MAAEYLAITEQAVSLNSPINFIASIPCRRGCVCHEDGTGVFILRGNRTNNNCQNLATYQILFSGNIAIPDGGAVTPIGVAISVSGEPRQSSLAVSTPAATDEYNNINSPAIVKVPNNCCVVVSVRAVSAVTDPTVTPTPIINVRNANLVIDRIA